MPHFSSDQMKAAPTVFINKKKQANGAAVNFRSFS
jgi:hypothetical protein